MKLKDILETYETHLLDQIAADKVDEAITLRLPQSIIVQEIISALCSQSYISSKVLYGKPPTYAILNTLLHTPGYMVAIEGFQALVLDYVTRLKDEASLRRFPGGKDALLYCKILKRAWENDNQIDKSEGCILELVKQELGIWDREHYLLMHDESIIGLWNIEQEYYSIRNQLLSCGILLTWNNHYVIGEEVAFQIRKAFGIEISDDSLRRLLDNLSKEDLSLILEHHRLNVSGSKLVQVDRLLKSLIPPPDMLEVLNLESLRELCRQQDVQVGGAKNIVIANLIRHFDEKKDLLRLQTEEFEPPPPPEPEVREMDANLYSKVLMNLTGQQLYDILSQSGLMTSGSKDEKVKRIVECIWSERTIFSHLRKEDLAQLCRRYSLPVSGSKPELIDRILDYEPAIMNEVVTKDAPVSSSLDEIGSKTSPQSDNSLFIAQPAPPPPNWEEINAEFGELKHDEKVVLAVLADAKSITERDLERIVASHKLGWFLLKAHMAELMAKLKQIGQPYIQIKSVQNSNIYQWNAATKVKGGVEKKCARDIIDALRHGVVPKNNLALLMVGQESARRHLSEILLEVNSHKSHFKFIRGQYGSGKTFLCSWLKEFALENEYAVSFLNISHDQPLSDLPIFFSGIINGLRTPEKTDSSALVDVLESWLLNIHYKTAKIEGIEEGDPNYKEAVGQVVQKVIEAELANLNDIEPGFSQALRAFYEGKIKGDLELASNAISWITGSKALSSQALREIGVKGYLEANNVFQRMRAILEVISGARYRGTLILVDELELIRKFPHARQREQALESLRLLIDEAGRNALPGCLIIFTGTDEFFEDQRYGLKSYEALAERVMAPLVHEDFVSMRQPIISLEALDNERLIRVIRKIRDLYGIAYACDAKQFASDTSIAGLVEGWTLFGDENIERKPRPILREFIQMLDLCEENKGVDISQFLKRTKTEVLQPASFNSN